MLYRIYKSSHKESSILLNILCFLIILTFSINAQEKPGDGTQIKVKKADEKKTNGITAAGDKVMFKDGTTTLMEINSEGTAGSLILPSVGSTLTGTKLYNNGGNLYWGNSQLGLAGGGVTQINDLSDGKSDGSSVFLGSGSGNSDDGTNNFNTAVGQNALFSNTGGYHNTASGYYALYSNITGFYNTANGSSALYSNTGGYSNTANGYYALYSNKAGSNGVAFGFASQRYANNTSTVYINANTSVGYESMLGSATPSNNTGNYNSAFGYETLYSNATGSSNTANGSYALGSNTTGGSNTANGYLALYSNEAGSNGVAIGYQSQYYANNTTTAYTNYNTSVGYESLLSSTTPSNNTGNYNSAFGYQSLYSNTSGSYNAANGYDALSSNTTGSYNTANGTAALLSNTSGGNNTANGNSALRFNTSGNSNTAIGYKALYSNQTGSGNVTIGYQAGYNETGSNKLYIENSNSSTPLIGGDFLNNEVYLNGKVGIYTSSPEGELHINAQSVTRPAIFIENATASEGDITWDSNEHLQIGTWNQSTNTFSEKMRIEFGGDVGIGNTNPSHLLDVGTNGAYCDGGAWVNGSSRAFKNNIEALTLEEAEKAFAELEPVKFTYKTTPEEKHVGFIAEDVPDLVATKDRKGLTALDIVAVLTKVVQKQQQVINKLEKENSGINKRLSILEQKLGKERFTSIIK